MKVKRIICLLILIVEIFIVNSYATNVSALENNMNTTNTSQSKTTKKSDNADLKTLQISNGKLSPDFDKDITEYYTNVDLSVNKITTKVTLAYNKSTVKFKGNRNLKEGENKIELTVTAESGKKKVYYIYVNKKSNEESDIKAENVTEIKNEITKDNDSKQMNNINLKEIEVKKEDKQPAILSIAVLGIFILILFILIIKKNRK